MSVSLATPNPTPHLDGLVVPASMQAHALKVVIVNNMPNKADTEADACRFFGSLTGNYHLNFTLPGNRRPTNLSLEHAALMQYHAARETDIADADIVLLTGSPVATQRYTDIESYAANAEIVDWARKHNKFLIGWCWGGMALVHHLYGIEQNITLQNGGDLPLSQFVNTGEQPRKIYGLFQQELSGDYAESCSEPLHLPVSRRARYYAEQFANTGFEIISNNAEAGPGILWDVGRKIVVCLNHPEYARDTLLYEYVRDGADLLKQNSIPYPAAAGGTYPNFLNLDRKNLVVHAVLVHAALEGNNIAHPEPANYPLLDGFAQRAAQKSYAENAGNLFNTLLAEGGLVPRQMRPGRFQRVDPAQFLGAKLNYGT